MVLKLKLPSKEGVKLFLNKGYKFFSICVVLTLILTLFFGASLLHLHIKLKHALADY